MGLIKALTSATSQTLGDQFKEFVTCPEIDKNVLIQRGQVEHGKGNKNPSEGVISNGSYSIFTSTFTSEKPVYGAGAV